MGGSMRVNYRPPYPNELCHHGILGQKWGIRRYQNPDGTLTAAGRERYKMNNITKEEKDRFGTGHAAVKAVRNINGIIAGGTGAVNYVLLKFGMISPHLLATTAVTTGAALAASAVQSKIEKKIIEKHGKPHEDPEYEFPVKKKEMSPEKDLKEVNKGHGDLGTTNNCLFCSASYELRRRGYDVMAEISEDGNNAFKMEKYFNRKMEQFYPGKESVSSQDLFGQKRDDNIKKIKNNIDKMPNGARGYIGLSWGRQSLIGAFSGTICTGGHATTWEKINGNIVIREAQSGRTINFDDYMTSSNSQEKLLASPIFFMRWDDAEINMTAISEAVFK